VPQLVAARRRPSWSTPELPNAAQFTYYVKASYAERAPAGRPFRDRHRDQRAPVAIADSFSTGEETTLTANVVANDVDGDSRSPAASPRSW